MSKLSFRARALDASKPMPIYLAEELPDLPDYSAINRAVPQMPSGMEKEEESKHASFNELKLISNWDVKFWRALAH
ncbi:Enhancer of polycomb-like protein, partial [Operophtera brumata]